MAAAPEFGSPRASASRRKFAVLWRWWTSEIAKLVPERFSMLSGGGRVPLLALEGDAVVLASRTGAVEARADLAALDETRRSSAVRALLERAGESRGRARLALGHEEALVRKVTMPAATEENLRQVLAFEMDRLTPFRADEVYFDCRVISRDATTGQIVVQLAMARRELVDARVQALRALGVNVQGVAVGDKANHGVGALDLMPTEQRGESETSRERLVQYGMAGTCVLLFLAALVYPVYQKRETFKSLAPLVNKARQDAEATDAIARTLDKQVADYNFLLTRKHVNAPALALIEEISRLLPDNTWVTSLEVKNVGKVREVQVIGETVSSSKLIEIFEGSSLMQNAAPRGTVTRGSQPGTERFMIVAEAKPRVLPEARPVMEVATVMQPAAVPAPAQPAPAQPTPPATVVTPVPAPAPATPPKPAPPPKAPAAPGK